MAEKQPLVSVIVPVYGIERYIGSCIESLMAQTYPALEIILVDDGSRDRSGEICDLYARKDPRIRVIHKENGGLVSARKAGLLAAGGVYIGYVDGDDWVEPPFYEGLVEAITRHDSDLALEGMSRDLFDVRSRIPGKLPAGLYEGEALAMLQRNMMIFGEFCRIGVSTYVWNKLFRREKLLDFQLAVDNGISIGEDAALTYPYLMSCRSVCIIDRCDYHYRQREDSMLKQTAAYSHEVIGLKKLYRHLLRAAEATECPEIYREQIRDFVLGICIMRSGGVLRELQNDFSPYNREFYGSDIVVYSAGTFGQQLVRRIEENRYCRIVRWVDVDYREYRRCCMDVDPIESITQTEFDYILIATVDGVMAETIRRSLLTLGVEGRKILSVTCPVPRRARLLERYLAI